MAGVLLGACALSPQEVTVKPLVDVQSQPIGRDRLLSLEVIDRRPRQTFGARGGIYDTAVIAPRGDVAQTVWQALAERLRADQFKVIGAGEAPLAMRVELLRIEYLVNSAPAVGGPLVNEIRVNCAIQASIRNAARAVSGQYQANSARRQLGFPNAADNEAMLNEAIHHTLRQLLQDPAVLKLLAA
ncbi:MAG: YajG family lipoprotein [Gammaproteobacteria bacterium]